MIKKKNLSIEDKKTWEDFTKHPSDIYDKEKNNSKLSLNKKRYKFDLHGFNLIDANKKVKEIIFSCVDNKYKEILLITGKGLHSTTDKDTYVSKDLSKLKFSVPEFIYNDNEISKHVIKISEASIRDGGAGAILIELKNFIK